MSKMFYFCESIKSIPFIKLWNFGNVKDMSKMFYHCEKMKPIKDLLYMIDKIKQILNKYFQDAKAKIILI